MLCKQINKYLCTNKQHQNKFHNKYANLTFNQTTTLTINITNRLNTQTQTQNFKPQHYLKYDHPSSYCEVRRNQPTILMQIYKQIKSCQNRCKDYQNQY
ncbi:unnamed protein product [Paramecium sonneborni]|uniref:Uncharacterized protein n=1 Tax=Paramecium sonneborni TaxID=65129 RepID=A0A8S1RTD1_9CILI|nr:unnamed protein product [Paramecium sonneborni]